MKKFFAVVLGVALCFTLVTSASAINSTGASLEGQTTEGLYDRCDAFDKARAPGLLYMVEPLHLWTVGSGYSDGAYYDDSNSFMVGVARKVGPGSLAFFFETNKNAWEVKWSETHFRNNELDALGDTSGFGFWQGALDVANQYPNYDGELDFLDDWGDNDRYDYEWEEFNYSVAYSMDVTDTIAVGASYEPMYIDENETIYFSPSGIALGDSYPYPWDGPNPESRFYGAGDWGAWFFGGMSVPTTWNTGGGPVPVGTGWNGGAFGRETSYWDVEHSAYDTMNESSNFTGDRDTDQTVHPLNVQTHIRPNDNFDILLGIGYADVDSNDIVTGTYSSSSVYEEFDADGTYFGNQMGHYAKYEGKVTFALDGSLNDDSGYNGDHVDNGLNEDRQGDQWSFLISPTYHFNEMYSGRLDISYANQQGDFEGGLGGRLDYWFHDYQIDDDPAPGTVGTDETLTGYEIWDGRSSGDYETTSWAIEPRLYVNFDKVRFAAGVGYSQTENDWDGNMAWDKTAHYEWDDAVTPTNSGSFDGSWTGRQNFTGEDTTTVLRCPVAVEFDLTEKVVARVGAAYYRIHEEEKRHDAQYLRENEAWTEYDENGEVVDVGFKELLNSGASSGTPYDNVAFGTVNTTETDETWDFTTYNLGLGYYFTENLQFDMMFSGEAGWVNSSQLFCSFTIIFP
jgi:hypothetical protein